MAKHKGKKQVRVTILYGLPGSGKTHTAEKHQGKSIIDLDKIVKAHGPNKFAIMSALNKEFEHYSWGKRPEIIIDGLVTTNSQLRDIMDSLQAQNNNQYELVFELIYWNEDREACLHNDQGRRAVSSATSIKHLLYEKPDLSQFPELNHKRVTALKVIRKSSAISWIVGLMEKLSFDRYRIDFVTKNLELRSETWSLGGTWCDCWGGSGDVGAEDPLEDFADYDKLIELIDPNISYLNYKKLKAASCRILTDHQGDYYGGSVTYARHVCNIQALYDTAKEMGLVASEQV